MYLKRCEIKNFRSISDLKIAFENNFQILVGLNESGKSNILKALSFIDLDISPVDDDIRDPRHDENPVDESYVRFVFGLEKKNTKEIFEKVKPLFQTKKYSIPIVQVGSNSYSLSDFCDFKKEGLYTVNILDKKKYAQHWNLHGSHYAIVKSWKKVPKDWDYANFDNKTFKFIHIEDYPDYKDHPDLEDISINDVNDVVGEEIVKLVKKNLPECIAWRYSETNLLPGRIDINSFKADPDTCEPLRNIFYLSGFNDILATITEAENKTNGITNLLRRLSKNSTSHLRRVWPEYSKLSITLNQNGSVIEAGIEDEFNVYRLDRRSDGFKRFITFLLMISAQAKSDYLYESLIIIDEPDIGLHPSGIQYLRDELKKVAKQNLVVIATHSIFMIDKNRIDRHIIVKKEKEVTRIVSDYSSDMLDEEVIYRALGYSLFELLKKKNFVFEGWTDKQTFQCWLNSKRVTKTARERLKDYGMLYALGAKDVQRVASNLENLDREYLIISDADQPSLDYKKKFNGKYEWFTYHDLGFNSHETIEDFLDENYVVKAIQNTLQKEQLDKNLVIPTGVTFNKKIEHIFSNLGTEKKERDRLKKIFKNEIFENLDANVIQLDSLIAAVTKHC